ncbi:hypothetical protein [Pelobacter seleniigenes]|uniref:hypothetical protein n=1 Tax=Pelobacter seleniigenes TaxID=407188 RepID=UPI0004A75E04|nr:hypothetical protein [Pelobacter seleniigenes]
MKKLLTIAIFILICFSLAACAPQKIVPPKSGPTAQLHVNAINLAKRGIFKAEAVWVSLYNQDESWGAQPILVDDHPADSYIIPAGEKLKFSLRLQQGGPGYDGGCFVGLELTAEENSNLSAEFSINRIPGAEAASGCKLKLSNNGKLVGEYDGKPQLTFYKVKVISVP